MKEQGMTDLYGGIEAGGTKFVCVVGSGPGDMRAEMRIPTTSPIETIGKAMAFFRTAHQATPLAGIGIASFGPLVLERGSSQYGFITSTVKPGWADTNIVGLVRHGLDLPIAIDTDVNGAALAEYVWGAGQKDSPIVYMTVGTGIGVGVVVGGKPVHGLIHPEGGHVLVPHDWQSDAFAGVCQFHGDCFEGLASGPAMQKRWGMCAENLPNDHPGWNLEAGYIALAVVNIICTLSPRRIVLGGGVIQHVGLLPLIRQKVIKLLNGYVRSPVLMNEIDGYIVPPSFGESSGSLGAIALARTEFGLLESSGYLTPAV
jgi:fructokinase